MREVSVRRLGAEHWLKMGHLRLKRSTHAGVAVDSLTSIPLMAIQEHYLWSPNLVVGSFVEGRLTSFICAYATPDFWVLDIMVSDEDPKDLRMCLDYCLEHYEARGVDQFYYAFPKKWARAYKSFWREKLPRLQKYTLEDQEVVEPYCMPSQPWLLEHVMHGCVVPMPLLIRRSYVKKPTRG